MYGDPKVEFEMEVKEDMGGGHMEKSDQDCEMLWKRLDEGEGAGTRGLGRTGQVEGTGHTKQASDKS